MIVAKGGSRLSCAGLVRRLRRTDLARVQGLRQTRGAGLRCPGRGAAATGPGDPIASRSVFASEAK
ncbi:hypothetical protein GCM10007890_16570 [Methylobacterium tardum]|uniref:Uncharacterized protein n=1 Tax=Methylobacterium tardum TaxID=374432 RepID=A0AA37TA95_9HYPH|nr:hypothetical protein GCM10007890_16570 [Methylobacterium tardum]